MKPAVLTFRPDNFLTVGVMALVMYLLAVGAVQIAARAGLVTLGAGGNAASAGSVVV
jgi:hypothetical protein